MGCPAADRLTIQLLLQINKPKWDAWKMLPEAVKCGAVPFALAHGGLDMHQVSPPACTFLWHNCTEMLHMLLLVAAPLMFGWVQHCTVMSEHC